jgi:hypothetical protein
MTTRYLSAEGKTKDDFGLPFLMMAGEFVYDGQTKAGPWAMMSQISWEFYGCGQLGLGKGQKYVRQENGELHLCK